MDNLNKRKVNSSTTSSKIGKICKAIEPNQPSEFEIQATIYAGLQNIGINARGEVKAKFTEKTQVRFDIAVFELGSLVGIIEVKKSKIQHKTTWEATRQGTRYKQFNVPIRLVYGMNDAMDLLQDAEKGKLWKKTTLSNA